MEQYKVWRAYRSTGEPYGSELLVWADSAADAIRRIEEKYPDAEVVAIELVGASSRLKAED